MVAVPEQEDNRHHGEAGQNGSSHSHASFPGMGDGQGPPGIVSPGRIQAQEAGNLPHCTTCPVLDMCPQVGVTAHR